MNSAAGAPRVLGRRRRVDEQTGGVGHHVQVGDREGDRLLAADRTAERLPLQGVVPGQVPAGADAAQGQRGDRHPAVVEDGQELGVALARAPRAGRPRARATSVRLSGWVSEACQPSLSYAGLHGQTRRARRNQQRRDLGAAVGLGSRPGGDGDHRGDVGAGVGDELLGPVDQPAAAGRSARRSSAVAEASEPASGSVSPNAASACPASRSGSQRCFCSGCRRSRSGCCRARRPPPA